RIAMAIGPNFRSYTRHGNERIVRRNRTVGTDANDRSDVIREILSAFPAVTKREKQMAVHDRDAASDLVRARRGGALKDELLTHQPVGRTTELWAHHPGRGRARGTMDIGEVDGCVARSSGLRPRRAARTDPDSG